MFAFLSSEPRGMFNKIKMDIKICFITLPVIAPLIFLLSKFVSFEQAFLFGIFSVAFIVAIIKVYAQKQRNEYKIVFAPAFNMMTLFDVPVTSELQANLFRGNIETVTELTSNNLQSIGHSEQEIENPSQLVGSSDVAISLKKG